MVRVKFLIKISLAFLSLAYATSIANAGMFGPNNYDECMIDQMRGQSVYMSNIAAEICLQKFPPPPYEEKRVAIILDATQINYRACSHDQSEVRICVEKKPENYNITKVEIGFINKSPCEHSYMQGYGQFGGLVTYEPDAASWKWVEADKRWLYDVYYTSNHTDANCWDVRFWGFS